MLNFGRLKWMVLIVATYAYASFVGYMLHSPIALVQEAITWAGPLAFALYLFVQREHVAEMLETFRDQFMLGTLVMGLYGIYQYVFLAPWDATWMEQSTLSTIGTPEPFGVRVFSTMNAPQTFADFIVFGILFSTASTRRLRFFAIPVGLMALGLTNSRSAWIGGVVGMCFIIFFFPAKRRLQIMMALLGSVLLLAVLSQVPEVNEQLTRRLQSFTDLKTDSSVNARMLSQEHAITMFGDRAFGNGFGGSSDDTGSGPTFGVATIQGVYLADNGIEQFMLTFGWFGSVVFAIGLGGLVFTCLHAPSPQELTPVNAALLSLIVQMPTMGLFASTPAFLLWSSIMMGIAYKENVRSSGTTLKPVSLNDTQVQTI
ncbi:O-antigen ligase family protein [Terriglobus roseus]|nr:O-antigen ligase family protein [Terriglobus roseus]